MQLNGLPDASHTMLSAGPRAAFGLPSHGLSPVPRGEPITMAGGLHGALSTRAGFLAAGLPTFWLAPTRVMPLR